MPVAVLSLLVGGCGSNVDRVELEAFNGRLGVEGSVAEAEVGARPDGVARPDASGASNGAAATSGGDIGASPANEPTGGPAAAAGVGGAVANEGPRSEIVLGSFGTGSGVIGQATRIIRAATRAWQEDVNARGGLNGHPVRIVYGETGGDPARAAALARQMVEDDGAIGFIGLYTVVETPGILEYIEANRIPVVGAPGGSAVEDASPMIFNPQQGADVGVGWSALLSVTSQSPHRKFAVLYCAEASSCSNQLRRIKELSSTVGVEVVYEAQVSIAAPDFTAQVLGAQSAGADVIAVMADSPTIVRVADSARRAGFDGVVSGTYTVNNEALTARPEISEGILGMAATVPYSTSPLLDDYRGAMARYQPGEQMGGFGATAWVQAKLWERLAQSFGATVTSSDVVAALYALRDESLGGLIPPITFNDGPHGAVNLCGVPIRIADGKITAPLGNDFVCPPSH